MSAPTQQQTGLFFYVPNSLIENLRFFTHAEFAMAMLVLRRSHSIKGGPIPVSDENWKNWTGLSARQKEYAVAGLAKKGLSVEGRGDKARYSWQFDMWESYARQTAYEEKTKTEGRKPATVPAKKGAMVHPDCANGCAMLQGGEAAAAKLILLPAGKIEQAWPASLAQLRDYFPLVSGAFLARLVGVVKTSIGVVTDAELAHAVTIAYKHHQQREGLFLSTVPEALAAIRRVKAKPVPPAAGGVSYPAIVEQIEKVIAVLYGDVWAPRELVEDLERLLTRVASTDLQQLDDEMTAIEKRIIEAAHVSLADPQRAKIRQRVAVRLKPYADGAGRRGGPMTPDQLDRLARQFLEVELLKYFAVPRLGVFYV